MRPKAFHPGQGVYSFNSRTPGGVRHGGLPSSSFTLSVSIHAPRGGCDTMLYSISMIPNVSIHAPREGCDEGRASDVVKLDKFQFTHPGRGATKVRQTCLVAISLVSIHAPREGCDCTNRVYLCSLLRFNSRTPGGVRQCGAKLRIMGRINKRNLRLAVLL